jgi:hypothetical protein
MIIGILRTTIRVTGGYLKDGTSSLKGVTVMIFTISIGFQRSRKKHYFGIFFKKPAKYVKTISAHSKNTVLIF